eukprot:GILJ01016287.1.p1 GENE.GILJ01016287.1~~GILJ01016287.1.p1  ORF type:complete len:194 (+),score=12.69 GILJ01016287.1:60-584(+)
MRNRRNFILKPQYDYVKQAFCQGFSCPCGTTQDNLYAQFYRTFGDFDEAQENLGGMFRIMKRNTFKICLVNPDIEHEPLHHDAPQAGPARLSAEDRLLRHFRPTEEVEDGRTWLQLELSKRSGRVPTYNESERVIDSEGVIDEHVEKLLRLFGFPCKQSFVNFCAELNELITWN